MSADRQLVAERVAPFARARLTAIGLHDELTGSWRLAADMRSFARLTADALGYRGQRVLKFGDGRLRTVTFKDGTALTYRLNRGDVRSIAETWMRCAYELPFELRSRTMVDFGANIGAAAVWLARRYGAQKIVAVEPAPENAELARINLSRTGVDIEVLGAAVGARDGRTHFELSDDSTLGRIGTEGIDVPLVRPQSVIDRFAKEEQVDLVKMDVEGAEQEIFESDLSWLDPVRCFVIELHADRVDWKDIIGELVRLGFAYHPIAAGNHYCGPTDVMAAFIRP